MTNENEVQTNKSRYLIESAKAKLETEHSIIPATQYSSIGPVFDKKRNYKFVTNNFFLILSVLVGIITLFTISTNSLNRSKSMVQETVKSSTIAKIVVANDSYSKIARRAISDYLEQNRQASLTPAQRLFMETKLSHSASRSPLKIGETITFDISKLEALILESERLTAFQLQKWSALARNVKF